MSPPVRRGGDPRYGGRRSDLLIRGICGPASLVRVIKLHWPGVGWISPTTITFATPHIKVPVICSVRANPSHECAGLRLSSGCGSDSYVRRWCERWTRVKGRSDSDRRMRKNTKLHYEQRKLVQASSGTRFAGCGPTMALEKAMLRAGRVCSTERYTRGLQGPVKRRQGFDVARHIV